MHKIELSILENVVLNFRNDLVVGNSHELLEMKWLTLIDLSTLLKQTSEPYLLFDQVS